MKVTFIIHAKNGSRQQFVSSYEEGKESNIDAAWDEAYDKFPDADYIERW